MPLYIHFFCYYILGVSSFNVCKKLQYVLLIPVSSHIYVSFSKVLKILGVELLGCGMPIIFQLHKVMSGCPPGCHGSLFPPPPPQQRRCVFALYCHSTCSCQSLNFASHYKIHFFMCHFSA